MVREDSPLAAATQSLIAKNAAELNVLEKSYEEIGKALEGVMAAGESLAAKMDGLAEMDEYKVMMETTKACMEKCMAMHEKSKSAADDDDEKTKSDEEDEEKNADTTNKADDAEKADEDEGKSKEADEKNKSEGGDGGGGGDATMGEIRDLMAQLHSKLGPAADAEDDKEKEEKQKAMETTIAKGLGAIDERLDRVVNENTELKKRLKLLEGTTGQPRGTTDGTKEVAKSDNMWAGIL